MQNETRRMSLRRWKKPLKQYQDKLKTLESDLNGHRGSNKKDWKWFVIFDI